MLNVGCDDEERHRELVSFLSERAEATPNGNSTPRCPTSNTSDWRARHTSTAWTWKTTPTALPTRHRGRRPAKSTTARSQETGEPVITIGYGPDFAVLRSDGVRLDIPEMVTELNEEVVGGGVSGGGHLVVGSIKFVKGMREQVLDALVEKMADAELDEDLQSTTVGHQQDD